MALSILARKRDLTYLIYFTLHLFIMFREPSSAPHPLPSQNSQPPQ